MKTARSSWILAAFVFLSCNGKWFSTEPNKDNCTTEVGAAFCKEEGGLCDVATGKCRKDLSCALPVDCAMASAAWCKEGQCVPCDVDTRCIVWSNDRNLTPRRGWCANLDNSPNTCAQCRPGNNKTDCLDPMKSICDSKIGECRPCQKDNDCESGVCRKPGDYPTESPVSSVMTGQCVPQEFIAYVNNSGTPACVATTVQDAGSQMLPVCTIQDARMLTPARPYIRLIGSATPYVVPPISAGSAVVVGPGRTASPAALVQQQVMVNGGKLVLQGVQIDVTTPNAPGVRCSSGEVYVLDSALKSEDKGIDGTGCGKLFIERTRIRSQERSIMANGEYRIVNTAVSHETQGGGVAPEDFAVQFAVGAFGYFAFNTIAHFESGVNCQSAQTLTDSIIATRVTDATLPSCTLQRVVTGVNSVELELGLEPKLANKGAKNSLCCVDQGRAPGSNQSVPTDYFGTQRPNGEEYDIGFHEIQ